MFRALIFVFLVTFLGSDARETATNQLLDLCPLQLPRNKLMSFGDVCLQFRTHKVDWSDARTDCRRHGGDLVTITTQEKEKFILNQLRAMNWRHSVSSGVWLGTTDRQKEGTWLWVNGSPMDFGDWHPGQGPSHHGFFFTGGSLEDCALLRLDDSGRWHDYPCEGGPAYHYSYICEYKKIQIQKPEVSSLSSVITMSTNMPTNVKTMSSPMPTHIKTVTTSMPTNSKLMTSVMPTNSKMMTTAMPTNSKIMTTAMPTNSKLATKAMPTNSKMMTTAMPTNSKMITTALPTNSKMMTTAMLTNSKMMTTVMPTNSKTMTSSVTQ